MQPNVHDAFFKAMLSQPEHAASVLRNILPAALAARVDFASLGLEAGSYVDEALKERQSDLLFSAAIGGRSGLIYLLCEHQSSVDTTMSFRLLRYMVRIWETWQRDHEHARKLPLIVPVVLHHSEEGWRGGTAFEDMLDADEETLAAAADHAVRFRFVLEDISHESDEALRARAMTALARLSLWCLRHSREPDELVDRLTSWLDLVREVRSAPGGAAALVRILRYIFLVNEKVGPEQLVARLLAAVGDEGKEEIMTAGEVLIERGREQKRREMLLDLLRERFGVLPDAVVARVGAAPRAELVAWSKRFVTAAALDDVFAGA